MFRSRDVNPQIPLYMGSCTRVQYLYDHVQNPRLNVHTKVSSGARDPNFCPILLDFRTLRLREAKAQARLRICADSPEHSLLGNAKSTENSCTCPIILRELNRDILIMILAFLQKKIRQTRKVKELLLFDRRCCVGN